MVLINQRDVLDAGNVRDETNVGYVGDNGHLGNQRLTDLWEMRELKIFHKVY